MLVPGVEGAGRAVPLEPRGRGSSLPSKGQRRGERVAPKGPETILLILPWSLFCPAFMFLVQCIWLGLFILFITLILYL